MLASALEMKELKGQIVRITPEHDARRAARLPITATTQRQSVWTFTLWQNRNSGSNKFLFLCTITAATKPKSSSLIAILGFAI